MTHPSPETNLPRYFRLRWVVGFVAVLIVPLIMLWFWSTGSPWVFVALPLIIYGAFPIADLFLGRDSANLTEAQEQAVEKDPYFRGWLYRILPSNPASDLQWLSL